MADDLVEYEQENRQTAYEQSDWRLSWVGWTFLGTFVLLVISPFVLMAPYSNSLSDTGRRLYVEPPAPRLQVAPYQDLARLRAAEHKKLDTYYWIDKSKGIVHIPIEQAMKKLAREGIPGFPKVQQ